MVEGVPRDAVSGVAGGPPLPRERRTIRWRPPDLEHLLAEVIELDAIVRRELLAFDPHHLGVALLGPEDVLADLRRVPSTATWALAKLLRGGSRDRVEGIPRGLDEGGETSPANEGDLPAVHRRDLLGDAEVGPAAADEVLHDLDVDVVGLEVLAGRTGDG